MLEKITERVFFHCFSDSLQSFVPLWDLRKKLGQDQVWKARVKKGRKEWEVL